MANGIRELQKEITLGEDVYVLKKMDPFAGTYLIKFATSKLVPLLSAAEGAFAGLLKGQDAPKKRGKNGGTGQEASAPSESDMLESAMKLLPGLLDEISEEELKTVMTRCLNYVYKRLPGGDQPVMLGNEFALEEAMYDTGLCLALCVQALIFNCGDFFGGSGSVFARLKTALTSLPRP